MIDGEIRLLAAVMFADIVGYTTMMQEDEEQTKKLRDRHRKVMEERVTEHQGSILQYFGDGTLCIFGSAFEAVRCAIDIQRDFRQEPVIPLRIGLHLGDIVYDDEGVYGDAVNLAARIEALSVPGSILISEKVYDEIRNHRGVVSLFRGSYHLKNIREPVSLYAINNEGLIVPSEEELRQKTGDAKKTVAVLPFVNMSEFSENEYFSDGITEEIINALTKVEGLQVISRTSTFAFKGLSEDVRKIGKKLSATYLLEGSVRKSGTKVRITAQLIDTTDGFHIWSEVFDRHLEDIFEVQDEIALKIAAKLRENFIFNERSPLQLSQGTDNVEAYNLYLKAQYFWYKWSPEYALKAIEYYNRALDAAPNYAKAYSGLASCYSYLAATGHLSPSDAYTKAEQAARKAIDLDHHLVESHVALGLVRLFYKWNFKGALKSFKKALKLNPESAKANHALSFYAKVVGDFPAALHLLQQALKVDPLSAVYKSDLARAYLGLGNVEKALNEFNEILEFDPEFRTAAEGRGWCYVMLEDYENARKEFKKYRKMIGKEFQGITQLGYVEAKMGNTDKVGEYLALLEHRQRQHPDQPLSMDFALIFLGLSKPDRVFHYLEQALDERLGSVLFIETSRLWDEIKGDKRYGKFIKRIGLEQAPNLAGLGSAINSTA